MNMTSLFFNAVATTFCTSLKAFQAGTFVYKNCNHFQFINVSIIIMLSIGNSRLQNFLNQFSTFFRAECQDI